jgi:heme-degrading monooxygenase HmoA
MVARIGTWQGSPEDIDHWIVRAREQVKPSIQQDRGLAAAYWLVDRTAGTAMIVTLWESEDAMRASEAVRARRQAGTAAATGARVTTARYEVVDQLGPAP